jgi:hypothetical protein
MIEALLSLYARRKKSIKIVLVFILAEPSILFGRNLRIINNMIESYKALRWASYAYFKT